MKYFIIKEIHQVGQNHEEEKTNSVNTPLAGGGRELADVLNLGALWCNMKDDNKMYVIVFEKNPKIQNPKSNKKLKPNNKNYKAKHTHTNC